MRMKTQLLLLSILFIFQSCNMPVGGGKSFGADPWPTPAVTFQDPIGVLDTSFGTNGVYYNNTLAYTGSLIGTQSNGKIIVVSKNGNNWVLDRFTANGAVDTSFGTAGQVTHDQGASITLSKMIITSDDKILIVGQTRVIQLNSDGSVNTNFGTAGTFAVAGLSARAAVKDSSGNFWLGGHSGVTLKLQKITSAGALVTTYSPIGGTTQVYGLAIDSSNNLYPVGIVNDGGFKGFLAKIKSDGTADTSFGGGDGWLSFTETGGYADTKAATLLSDGSIVVSGVMDATQYLFVAKISSSGSLDTTFGGGDGFVIEAFAGSAANNWYEGWDVQKLPNGKIVVVGNDADDAVVAKYDSNGNPDTSFGSSGILRVNVNGGTDIAEKFSVNPDGTILITGYSADKLYVAKVR